VPPDEMSGFEAFLEGLGYRYQREHENTAYNLFLAWQCVDREIARSGDR
jgi:hypothetical protein